jgi:hypothetical protein
LPSASPWHTTPWQDTRACHHCITLLSCTSTSLGMYRYQYWSSL